MISQLRSFLFSEVTYQTEEAEEDYELFGTSRVAIVGLKYYKGTVSSNEVTLIEFSHYSRKCAGVSFHVLLDGQAC